MRIHETPILCALLAALGSAGVRAGEAPAPYSPPARTAAAASAAKSAEAASTATRDQADPATKAVPAAAPAPGSTRVASPPAGEAAAASSLGMNGLGSAADAQAAGAAVVQQILKDKEDLISGKRFTYDPGGRRDPFRSLLDQVAHFKGPRPKGVTGMLVSEVDLQGVVKERSGNLAFLRGTDNKGYFVRIGDELYDGRVISIDAASGTVTFRQRVDDPRQIKPYRDVVKRLSTGTEEEAQ